MFNLKSAKTLVIASAVSIAAATRRPWRFRTKSIEYIIPFGPGGESDISARFRAAVFQGQVRSGSRGLLQARRRRRCRLGPAQLDGKRWPHDHGRQPAAHRHSSPRRRMLATPPKTSTPSTCSTTHPDAIVVTADSPYQTLDDLIADAKANPGRGDDGGARARRRQPILAQIRFDNDGGYHDHLCAVQGYRRHPPPPRSATRSRRNGATPRWARRRAMRSGCWQWRWKNVIRCYPDVPTSRSSA